MLTLQLENLNPFLLRKRVEAKLKAIFSLWGSIHYEATMLTACYASVTFYYEATGTFISGNQFPPKLPFPMANPLTD